MGIIHGSLNFNSQLRNRRRELFFVKRILTLYLATSQTSTPLMQTFYIIKWRFDEVTSKMSDLP